MFNELEKKALRKALHTPELKDYAIRLFNDVILNSTSVTAPEIKSCLIDIKKRLEDDKQPTKVEPNRYAE